MNLRELFEKQQQLDSYIEKKRGVTGKEVFQDKLLAFVVETGELANEVRSFKFWSSKEASASPVILEEYVDGLHFLLSLGNTLEFVPETGTVEIETEEAPEQEKTEAFLEINGYVALLRMEPSLESYSVLFQGYVDLAGLLGYTWEDVLAAYEEKNKENYSRQDNNY
ncbi:dUTP diphosphatase [Alkalicoccus halolimnae]|uniref:dUTP diphosphatase n=1 Tax=Alkalicoccus halolimnae TaxID=1667239 RepID=A0A5C7F6X9_9BACI|nr:dUTP diphosphatase [Alkalicoccus halolimnae]TXF85763.1 dUTPase [Alkalicoccus halolimnae]